MVYFGIDNFISHSRWKNAAVGLVTNHAATTRELVPSRKALLASGVKVVKLFSPEHGLDVKGADGHLMRDGMDALTNLPVVSLYSEKLAPSADDLDDIDVVLFDIPDVGSRFYTYLWTLTHVMEACAANNKPLVILDRPNPVSGLFELAEGPVLEESQASFIGRWPMPIRHSATLGELARYFNTTRQIGCDIEVVPCSNWTRGMHQPDWGTTFVATSPAICRFEAMMLYPGLCLLEATNISEGRSTELSFTAAGAPWLDARRAAHVLQQIGLDELMVVETTFVPATGKYRGELCRAVSFEVLQPEIFHPVFFGLLLIKLIRDLHPQHFQWQPYPTLVNPSGRQHLDKLLGIPGSESLFELDLRLFLAKAKKITGAGDWAKEMKPFLLY